MTYLLLQPPLRHVLHQFQPFLLGVLILILTSFLLLSFHGQAIIEGLLSLLVSWFPIGVDDHGAVIFLDHICLGDLAQKVAQIPVHHYTQDALQNRLVENHLLCGLWTCGTLVHL